MPAGLYLGVVAKLIKLHRQFEIKWDRQRGYVVISPSGKLITANLESASAAQRYIDRVTGQASGSTQPAKTKPKPERPEPVKCQEPPPPCERCGAEHTSPTAFRKDGLCGPCWIKVWAEDRMSN